ncbi:MAG: hypothetical protein O7H41_04080 [Planctomycetota bacterium]|nr:hypothetical protein [Planctomycetota bacterium]
MTPATDDDHAKGDSQLTADEQELIRAAPQVRSLGDLEAYISRITPPIQAGKICREQAEVVTEILETLRSTFAGIWPPESRSWEEQ